MQRRLAVQVGGRAIEEVVKLACQRRKLIARVRYLHGGLWWAELTFRKGVGMFADIASFLLAMRQPCC